MLGAIIGDICGSAYEFNNVRSTDIKLFPIGCGPTDDTFMSVAVAHAVMDTFRSADRTRIADSVAVMMRYYGKLFPDGGYGGNFGLWLNMPEMGPYGSYGNGSAMRVSSVGWFYTTLEETLDIAGITASVTHDHPEGIKGAQAVAGAVFLARTGSDKTDIRKFLAERIGYDMDFTLDQIRDSYSFDESCQGSVPQAMEAFLESEDFESCIRLAISLGGDSDTIACMAGAVAEAFYGKIPETMASQAYARLPEPLSAVIKRFDEFKRIKETPGEPQAVGGMSLLEAMLAEDMAEFGHWS